ncbi:MAG: hypothetical protein L0099_14805, partial [Acidobacteria bacterium]|nr:hypothetical protein [Acidobacteriota bacterium]
VGPADPHNRTFAAALAEKALTGRSDGMKLKLLYPAGDPAVHNACVLIKKQVQELQANLDLDLVPCTQAKLRQDVEVGHQYDLAYYCWDYPDHTIWLWPLFDPAGGKDFLGYQRDAQLGELFGKLLSHRDFQEVQKVTHQIHRHIQAQMPLIPLWQLDTHLVSHPSLELPANLDAQAVFSDVDAWKLEPR